jgi:MAF protein
MAVRLAIEKASAAAETEDWVLAADTLVVHREEVLGKPADAGEARRMLQAMSGEDHRVITAICLRAADGRTWTDVCETIVPMRAYDAAAIERTISSGSPLDKAGAYGIQDGAFDPVAVERLHGCFANVMGLPLCHLVRTLRERGIEPPRDVPRACIEFTGYDCPVFASILEGRE